MSARTEVTRAIEDFSHQVKDVLFVGVDTRYDYRHLFENYTTIDICPRRNPDIVGDIQFYDEKKYEGVIMTGVYEYLDFPHMAFQRISEISQESLICLPGEAFYSDKPTVSISDVDTIIIPLKLREMRIVYYKGRVSYIICFCFS
jgi:hypothetical protein